MAAAHWSHSHEPYCNVLCWSASGLFYERLLSARRLWLWCWLSGLWRSLRKLWWWMPNRLPGCLWPSWSDCVCSGTGNGLCSRLSGRDGNSADLPINKYGIRSGHSRLRMMKTLRRRTLLRLLRRKHRATHSLRVARCFFHSGTARIRKTGFFRTFFRRNGLPNGRRVSFQQKLHGGFVSSL